LPEIIREKIDFLRRVEGETPLVGWEARSHSPNYQFTLPDAANVCKRKYYLTLASYTNGMIYK
jgi:hypothetical protein